MRRSLSTVLVTALALGACSENATRPDLQDLAVPTADARVTVDGDAGPGAIQAALDEAAADRKINRIVLPGGTVELTETLAFEGEQNLTIEGNGTVLDFSGLGEPRADGAGLLFTGGGNVRIRDLTILDSPSNGLVVVVPADARGMLQVDLRDVTVEGSGLHGVWVDDQTGESDAGVLFRARDVRILDNGFAEGFSDFDGVRVDEGGRGNLIIDLEGMVATGNAGDGNEYDERGPGSVEAAVENSAFDRNGTQPQDPEDLEDGFDIDEADAGDIIVEMENTTASGNEDEGIDLDEDGDGDIITELEDVVANDNLDENIKYTEGEGDFEDGVEATGDVYAEFENVTANGSRDGDGIKLEEFGMGSLEGEFEEIVVNDNADDGFVLEEFGAGTLVAELEGGEVKFNADDGVILEQEGDETGTVTIEDTDISENGDEQIRLDGVEQVGDDD